MSRLYVIEVAFGRRRWIYGAYTSRRAAKRAFNNMPVIDGATSARLSTYARPAKAKGGE